MSEEVTREVEPISNEQLLDDHDAANLRLQSNAFMQTCSHKSMKAAKLNLTSSRAAILNKLNDLETQVDKLPKTADGFAIYPGLQVWYFGHNPISKTGESCMRSIILSVNHTLRGIFIVGETPYNTTTDHSTKGIFYRHPETGKTVKESEA